jgi:hypothetical protein
MKRALGIGLGIAAIAGLLVVATSQRGESQAGGRILLAIYAPTVQFADSAARLSYVQGLARAIEQSVGTRVEGRSYTNLAQLRRDNPDFAIVDAQCYAANPRWELLANGEIGGRATRPWALFSSVGPNMQGLRGQRLAFVRMGCQDDAFLEHAMLESEVDLGFFSARVPQTDLSGSIAEVVAYKGAQAVFAPIGTERGLTKVFDTGAVPGPAFVQMGKQPASVTKQVTAAVTGYGAGGAISGWSTANDRTYAALRARMRPRVKRGLFASPDVVRIDVKDVLIEPETLEDTMFTEVKQHFLSPPSRQE